MLDDLLQLDDTIRYAAIYRDGNLEFRSKDGTGGASSDETDRYEELLVNPTLLKLATQRGDIDCGGLDYLLIRYGNFFQLVCPMSWGHVSICIEQDTDPILVTTKIQSHLKSYQ